MALLSSIDGDSQCFPFPHSDKIVRKCHQLPWCRTNTSQSFQRSACSAVVLDNLWDATQYTWC